MNSMFWLLSLTPPFFLLLFFVTFVCMQFAWVGKRRWREQEEEKTEQVELFYSRCYIFQVHEGCEDDEMKKQRTILFYFFFQKLLFAPINNDVINVLLLPPPTYVPGFHMVCEVDNSMNNHIKCKWRANLKRKKSWSYSSRLRPWKSNVFKIIWNWKFCIWLRFFSSFSSSFLANFCVGVLLFTRTRFSIRSIEQVVPLDFFQTIKEIE